MDKYEEIVTAWRDVNGLYAYEIPHLCDLLRVYDAQRGKETCEWTLDIDADIHETSCGARSVSDYMPYPGQTFWCPYCGRRIVEKEGK